MSTIYTLNGKVLKNSANNKWLTKVAVDPYNPLGLPDNTLRIEVTEGATVNVFNGTSTQISSSPNVWEISDPNGTQMPYFYLSPSSGHVLKVLGAKRKSGDATSDYAWSEVKNHASYITYVGSVDLIGLNITGVFMNMSNLTHIGNVNMPDQSSFEEMFYLCRSLVEIGQIQMKSGVTSFKSCFQGCNAITELPTINLESATDVNSFMEGCYLYPHPLTIYNQLSNLGAQITDNRYCFSNCGRDTVTGAAELAQIPSSWGGTGA